VQEESCAALSNLCFDDENRRLAVAAGGVEAVVEALKAHRANAQVQEWACGILWRLCIDNDGNIRRAKELGAVREVEAALANHPDRKGLQKRGRRVLDFWGP